MTSQKSACRFIAGVVSGLLIAGFSPLPADAIIITYDSIPGSTVGGQPVDASATFTTAAGTLHISLTNNIVNPRAIVQNVSDLFFTLSGGQNTGTLTSSLATEVTVHADGSFTLGGAVPTGWHLVSTGTGLELCVIGPGACGGAPAPAHTLIGAPGGGGYTNANASIAGNGPHNPFLSETATFDLSITGLLADDTVTSATFSFGTTAGLNVPGCVRGTPGCQTPPTQIPEPATLTLIVMGGGLLGGTIARRRSSKP